jgi:hypothetical protein
VAFIGWTPRFARADPRTRCADLDDDSPDGPGENGGPEGRTGGSSFTARGHGDQTVAGPSGAPRARGAGELPTRERVPSPLPRCTPAARASATP